MQTKIMPRWTEGVLVGKRKHQSQVHLASHRI